MASRSARRDAIEIRRTQTSMMLLSGATQTEIAKALKVSVGTVNRDIQILRKRWQRQQMDNVELALLVDLMRVNEALRSLMPRVARGDLRATDRMIRLLEFRAKVLGYEAVREYKLQIEVQDIDAEIERELARLIAAGKTTPASSPEGVKSEAEQK